MRVVIVGAGHVGLVTAACLAEKGHHTICVDVDEERVRAIEDGRTTMYEPGLDELVRRNAKDRLRATTDLHAAVRASDLSLLTVPVPLERGEDEAVRTLRTVAREIGEALGGRAEFHAVVVRSTVLPGTTTNVVQPLVRDAADANVGVAMNPEFLTEGQAVADFMLPDRIVLGTQDTRTLELLEQLYAYFPGTRVRTTPTTAETIKLASNALLATMISFANELADYATELEDVDVADVTRAVHLSRYLTVDGGPGATTAPLASYIEAGCGFGGSCLPKDLAALAGHARRLDAPMELLEAAERVNKGRAAALVDLIREGLGSLAGARVSVLGLAFKPDTDDVRESPAFPVVERLLAEGADLRVYDPVATEAFLDACPSPAPAAAATLADALEADAVVIVTRWSEFAEIPELLRARQTAPLVVDGRRMINPHAVPRYAGVGLGRRVAGAVDAAR
jgi:UDPglucose 6-dehydrogenase/GDP-mannose 6-dehydrogenase